MALTKISGDVVQTPLNVGVVTATRIDGDVSGNVNSTGVSTFSTLKVGTGVTINSGIVTATTFSGNLTGNVTGNLTGNVTGNATGLSGTPNITVGAITASSAVISGNVSVAGTITYEDTTNVDSIGVITARNGIVVSAGSTSAPSISPTGDSNTGIFFPSADTVAIGEGGVEALRIHSSSNIGIGTTNPLTKVHIQGTGNGSSGSTGLSDSSSASALLLKPIIGSGTALALGTRNTGGHYIQGLYADSSVESVRDVQINPYGGSVGIGTFADAFGGSPGSSTFVVATTGLERLRIDSSGRVTMPYQPAFYTVHTATSGTNQQNTTVILTAPIINRGSAYSTSTGRYTCPVAGLYQFFFGTIKSDNGIAPDPRVSRFNIRKNGTNASTELRLSENGGYGESASLVCLVECVANDFIDVFIADTGGWYGNTYAHFGGFLIG